MRDYWSSRYTVRCFKNTPIPDRVIQSLINVSENIPTQNSLNDNIWFCLTNEKHYDLKLWLTQNVFNITEEGKETEYMVQVLSAPVVFLAAENQDIKSNPNDINRNIGIHAGALIEHALRHGLDVAYIGCTEGNWEPWQFSDQVNKVFHKQIKKMTKKKYVYFRPNLAVCIGKGQPIRNDKLEFDTYKGFRYAPWQKHQKNWTGIIK